MSELAITTNPKSPQLNPTIIASQYVLKTTGTKIEPTTRKCSGEKLFP